MAMKLPKGVAPFLKAVLLGGGVVVATPLLAGYVPSISLLETQIPVAEITFKTALVAGVSVFGLSMLLDRMKFLK
jgi:hypothetical protein